MDFRYLETNPTFERHAKRPMQGKRIKEIVPDCEQFWIDFYGQVAEPVEHVIAGLGNQWFHTSAFRIGGSSSRMVAVAFENVTERKRAEQALRKSEERQGYLVKLGDALRPLKDPVEVQKAAARDSAISRRPPPLGPRRRLGPGITSKQKGRAC